MALWALFNHIHGLLGFLVLFNWDLYFFGSGIPRISGMLQYSPVSLLMRSSMFENHEHLLTAQTARHGDKYHGRRPANERPGGAVGVVVQDL